MSNAEADPPRTTGKAAMVKYTPEAGEAEGMSDQASRLRRGGRRQHVHKETTRNTGSSSGGGV